MTGRRTSDCAPRRRPARLGEYAEHFLRDSRLRLRPRTLENYRTYLDRHIVPHLGAQTALSAIRREDIRTLAAKMLGAGLSSGTVLLAVATLRALLGHALDAGVIPAVPTVRMARLLPRNRLVNSARDHVLSPEELAGLLRVLRIDWPQVYALFLVAARSGCRIGELLGARWVDVDLRQRLLHVRHSLDPRGNLNPTKSGKPRVVPLSRAACDALQALHEARRLDGPPWVFLSSVRPRPWSRSQVRRTIRKACATAGLRLRSIHAIRATFATILAGRGTSPWVLKDLLGHSSIAITQRYVASVQRHHETVDLLDTAGGTP